MPLPHALRILAHGASQRRIEPDGANQSSQRVSLAMP